MADRLTAGVGGLALGLVLVAGAAAANARTWPDETPKPASDQSEPSKPVRKTAEWDLAKGTHLAIQGYDPVGYFPEGGGKATKGAKEFESTYEGATYRFATQAHKSLFDKDPARYEPAHGGWCSYAMWKSGDKVEIDPESFIVKDGRLFLFYDGWGGDTKKKWEKGGDHAAQAKAADDAWRKISGEEPRLPLTLQQQLDAKKAEFEARAPAATQEVYEKGIKDVGSSGVMASALKVGDTAPEFALPGATGASTSLNSMLEEGPVVLVWYRGGWCPYCNIQLHDYQSHLDEFKAAGGQLVAISPETPDHSMTTAEKQSLTFKVLSDQGNKVAKQFGIAYTLPKEVSDSFKGRLDLEKYNGDTSNELPLAAVYVVGKDRKISYVFLDQDYRKRAPVAEILKALESHKAKK